MITGIAHVCYHSTDLQRTADFYAKLGLPIAFEFKDEKGTRTGIYVRTGNRAFLEFFIGDAKPADGGTYRHISLECDDINKTVADLRANGLKVSDPQLGLDQTWQAWLGDPDGNAIELHCYTPASWQAPHL